MQSSDFEDLEETPLTTTDRLALGRTKLSNERTLLAFVRTFLAFIVAGVSLIQFFQVKLIIILGYALVVAGFIILIIGAIRFRKVRYQLNQLD